MTLLPEARPWGGREVGSSERSSRDDDAAGRQVKSGSRTPPFA
jgi:hypothetical protein